MRITLWGAVSQERLFFVVGIIATLVFTLLWGFNGSLLFLTLLSGIFGSKGLSTKEKQTFRVLELATRSKFIALKITTWVLLMSVVLIISLLVVYSTKMFHSSSYTIGKKMIYAPYFLSPSQDFMPVNMKKFVLLMLTSIWACYSSCFLMSFFFSNKVSLLIGLCLLLFVDQGIISSGITPNYDLWVTTIPYVHLLLSFLFLSLSYGILWHRKP